MIMMIMICATNADRSKIMHDISVIRSNLYSIPGVYLYLYLYLHLPLSLYLIKPVFHPRCVWKWWGLLVLTWFRSLLFKQMSKFVTFEALCTYYILTSHH